MYSKVGTARQILLKEGPVALAKKTCLYLARHTSRGEDYLYNHSVNEIQNRMRVEDGLDDILDTILEIEPGYPPYRISALQLRDEIEALANLVKEDGPETILEIGTAGGGTFYVWSRYLDSVQKLISLDLPAGEFGGGYNERKTSIFERFAPSKKMYFVRRNSHDLETFHEVSEYVNKVDFLFIDGDHTYEGVKQDFEMYSQLVSDDGLIAFHDIVSHPDDRTEVQRRARATNDGEKRHFHWGESHKHCHVDEFWTELVAEYDTTEFISYPEQTWGGIGVVRLG